MIAPGSQAARFSVEREPKVPKFKRCKISRLQLATLMNHFDDDPLPSFGKRQALAQTLNMTPRSVQIWFQNRRQRLLKAQNGQPGGASALRPDDDTFSHGDPDSPHHGVGSGGSPWTSPAKMARDNPHMPSTSSPLPPQCAAGAPSVQHYAGPSHEEQVGASISQMLRADAHTHAVAAGSSEDPMQQMHTAVVPPHPYPVTAAHLVHAANAAAASQLTSYTVNGASTSPLHLLASRLGMLMMGPTASADPSVGIANALAMLPQAVASGHVSAGAAALLMQALGQQHLPHGGLGAMLTDSQPPPAHQQPVANSHAVAAEDVRPGWSPPMSEQQTSVESARHLMAHPCITASNAAAAAAGYAPLQGIPRELAHLGVASSEAYPGAVKGDSVAGMPDFLAATAYAMRGMVPPGPPGIVPPHRAMPTPPAFPPMGLPAPGVHPAPMQSAVGTATGPPPPAPNAGGPAPERTASAPAAIDGLLLLSACADVQRLDDGPAPEAAPAGPPPATLATHPPPMDAYPANLSMVGVPGVARADTSSTTSTSPHTAPILNGPAEGAQPAPPAAPVHVLSRGSTAESLWMPTSEQGSPCVPYAQSSPAQQQMMCDGAAAQGAAATLVMSEEAAQSGVVA